MAFRLRFELRNLNTGEVESTRWMKQSEADTKNKLLTALDRPVRWLRPATREEKPE